MNNIDETIQGTNQQASSENAISPEAPTETSQTESREEPTHSPDTIEPSDEPVDEYGNDVSSSNEKKIH